MSDKLKYQLSKIFISIYVDNDNNIDFFYIYTNIGGAVIRFSESKVITYMEINKVCINFFCTNVKGFNKRDSKGLMHFQEEFLDD